LTKCCPKFLEKEHMLNGVHAAPGRQVSTWAHAVKLKSQLVLGVHPPFFHPSPEPVLTSVVDLCIPHASLEPKTVKSTCVVLL
jgi:hypothetical protein